MPGRGRLHKEVQADEWVEIPLSEFSCESQGFSFCFVFAVVSIGSDPFLLLLILPYPRLMGRLAWLLSSRVNTRIQKEASSHPQWVSVPYPASSSARPLLFPLPEGRPLEAQPLPFLTGACRDRATGRCTSSHPSSNSSWPSRASSPRTNRLPGPIRGTRCCSPSKRMM